MPTKKTGSPKHDIVQVKNPRTDRYVKIDRTVGLIVSHKKSEGPHKGIPVARKQKWSSIAQSMERCSRVHSESIRDTAFS